MWRWDNGVELGTGFFFGVLLGAVLFLKNPPPPTLPLIFFPRNHIIVKRNVERREDSKDTEGSYGIVFKWKKSIIII